MGHQFNNKIMKAIQFVIRTSKKASKGKKKNSKRLPAHQYRSLLSPRSQYLPRSSGLKGEPNKSFLKSSSYRSRKSGGIHFKHVTGSSSSDLKESSITTLPPKVTRVWWFTKLTGSSSG